MTDIRVVPRDVAPFSKASEKRGSTSPKRFQFSLFGVRRPPKDQVCPSFLHFMTLQLICDSILPFITFFFSFLFFPSQPLTSAEPVHYADLLPEIRNKFYYEEVPHLLSLPGVEKAKVIVNSVVVTGFYSALTLCIYGIPLDPESAASVAAPVSSIATSSSSSSSSSFAATDSSSAIVLPPTSPSGPPMPDASPSHRRLSQSSTPPQPPEKKRRLSDGRSPSSSSPLPKAL